MRKNLFLWMLFFFFIFLTSLVSLSTKQFVSPDETVNYFSSKNLANKGEFKINTTELSSPYLKPRGILLINDYQVSSKFLGMNLIWGILSLIPGEAIIKLIIPLLYSLNLIFLVYILNSIISFNQSLKLIMIVAFSPVLFYWASLSMYEDFAPIFFLSVSFYFVSKSIKSKSDTMIYYILSGFFIGISILIKPFTLILLPIPYLLLIFSKSFKKDFANFIIKSIIYGISVSIPLIILLSLNIQNYGSPLKMGFNVKYDTDILTPSSNENHLNKLVQQLTFLDTISPIFILLLLFSLVNLINLSLEKNHYFIVLLIFLSFTIFLLFISGFTSTIHSSYLRYSLFSILFFNIMGLLVLNNYLSKSTSTMAYTVIILISTIIIVSNLQYQYDTRKKYEEHLDKGFLNFTNNITNDTIILSAYWDKILFPNNKVIDTSDFTHNVTPLTKELVRLHKNNYTILAIKEENFNLTLLNNELNKYNLSLKPYSRYVQVIS